MEIRDRSLAQAGIDKINWVTAYMPVLAKLEQELKAEGVFRGKRIAMSIHLEAKTARLALLLKNAGAEVAVTGCNPLSTHDDICAGLVELGLEVNAWYDASPSEYERHLINTLSIMPDVIIDDGGDLVILLHGKYKALAENLIGGCEETTTGIQRLCAREGDGCLDFPMLAVNNARCKHLFDNRYGTGQSSFDGIIRTTNLIIAGKTVVVAGFGWCGKGIAMRAKGLGAKVVITEIDSVKAIEAVMEGFEVMTMDEASTIGDVFITVTGCCDVIEKRHFSQMKDGAILCNAGHFDSEINILHLKELSTKIEKRRKNIVGYSLPSGNTVNLLAEGRLVNLAAADGHPAEIMDMSFAIQALSLRHMLLEGPKMSRKVYEIPKEIDEKVAEIKLSTLGIEVDKLTEAQEKYIKSF
ncbi:MAG: adenosylhomocysteinase [Bacillota bacterium]